MPILLESSAVNAVSDLAKLDQRSPETDVFLQSCWLISNVPFDGICHLRKIHADFRTVLGDACLEIPPDCLKLRAGDVFLSHCHVDLF